MKFFVSAAAVLVFSTAAVTAQTLDDLKNDGKNTDNILTYGMAITCSATARSGRSTRTPSGAWCRYGA